MSNDTKMVKDFTVTTVLQLEDIILEDIIKKYPGPTKITTPGGNSVKVYVYKEGKGKDAQPSIVIE
mgnify:CR=1 FL=1